MDYTGVSIVLIMLIIVANFAAIYGICRLAVAHTLDARKRRGEEASRP